ncbi:MAG: hypothetical protein E6J90_48900 [Deltaproteobacteria bacterium]|nr:MAG: hypothetical protein E6J90_48900 [Deltaproteobacteria bacterium]TMQ10870.1 MAG: hypothetical protein E6J91_24875 [Deltaproteobacteria bacterium]
MTRLALGVLLVLLASAVLMACGGTVAIQCDQNSTCDLSSGGICSTSGTGNRWCAYPDPSCLSGYRYSTFQVGDGLSGVCIAAGIDAGVDAPSNLTCKRRVAFVDNTSGKGEIWVTNPDGSGLVNVSDNASSNDTDPNWSPNGLSIAFTSDRTGNANIFRVNFDGSGLVNLTNSTVSGYNPVWSPDGTRIAFVRQASVGPSRSTVWIMNANGSGATQVSILGFATHLAWSPGGDKLVFNVYDPTAFPGISVPLLYVADLRTGASPLKLTQQTKLGEQRVSWAPATRIAFDNAYDVITTNGDGANPVNVTKGVGDNYWPHIVHNGDAVILTSDRDAGHQEVWSVDANGGSPTQITRNTLTGGADILTDVSADELFIAYRHQTGTGTSEVGVISIDGMISHTFSAPGGSDVTYIKFASCP